MGVEVLLPRGRRVYRGRRRRRGRSRRALGAVGDPLPSQRPTSARTSSARSREPEPLDVAERRPGVAVDQDGARGAARERLDRQRAGAAVEVEDAGADDALAERREDRLADPVGGRPHLPARAARPGAAPSALRRSRLHRHVRSDASRDR